MSVQATTLEWITALGTIGSTAAAAIGVLVALYINQRQLSQQMELVRQQMLQQVLYEAALQVGDYLRAAQMFVTRWCWGAGGDHPDNSPASTTDPESVRLREQLTAVWDRFDARLAATRSYLGGALLVDQSLVPLLDALHHAASEMHGELMYEPVSLAGFAQSGASTSLSV